MTLRRCGPSVRLSAADFRWIIPRRCHVGVHSLKPLYLRLLGTLWRIIRFDPAQHHRVSIQTRNLSVWPLLPRAFGVIHLDHRPDGSTVTVASDDCCFL